MDEKQENKVEQVKELKDETVKSFNEVKEKMKNINLKEEAEAGKGLFKNLFTNPLKTIKEIAEDKENKTFKTSLLLILIWVIIIIINQVLVCATSIYAEFELLQTIKIMLAPILKIIGMTVALYIINNRAKDSISKVLTSVTIAHIPYIISSLLWLLYYISYRISYILTPISSLLQVISIILMYYTVKEYTKEEEEKALKKFVKVEIVYYIIAFAISFLGISI